MEISIFSFDGSADVLLCDDEDYGTLNARKWMKGPGGSVVTQDVDTKAYLTADRLVMQRVLGMNVPASKIVKHTNGNNLDCRRSTYNSTWPHRKVKTDERGKTTLTMPECTLKPGA